MNQPTTLPGLAAATTAPKRAKASTAPLLIPAAATDWSSLTVLQIETMLPIDATRTAAETPAAVPIVRQRRLTLVMVPRTRLRFRPFQPVAAACWLSIVLPSGRRARRTAVTPRAASHTKPSIVGTARAPVRAAG